MATRRSYRSLVVAVMTLAARATFAETPATDLDAQPLPGDESGRTDAPEQDSVARRVGRAVLAPPRLALEIAFAPVRAAAYVYDRYQLDHRYKQLFFDDSYTYGAYPTLVFDATYGLTAGARAVHRNAFGAGERVALRVGGGGEFHTRAELTLRSGERLGRRAWFEAAGEFEQRPEDRFFGIGNAVEPTEARHRQQLLRARGLVDVQVVSDLHLRGAGSLADIEYGRSSGYTPIDEIYRPMTLTAFTTGTRELYGEGELRWDRRQRAPFDEHHFYDEGWLLSTYAGRVHQFNARDDYWRYGGELQTFAPLGRGPRVFMTRLRTDAVTGRHGDVAFTELPQLGGSRALRGYPRERFRDRIAMVATAEYSWDLSRYMMASAFVDVGRVYGGWAELHYEDMRVGYGMSFQLHASGKFISALSIATSRDGGWFFDFTFDPVFDIEPRVEQQ